MKTFPTKMSPSNLDKFSSYDETRKLCYLRESIVNYIYGKLPTELSNKSNPDKTKRRELHGYELASSFTGDNDATSGNNSIVKNVSKSMIAQIRSELTDLGWKTKLAYGNTILFIYDEDKHEPRTIDSALLEN